MHVVPERWRESGTGHHTPFCTYLQMRQDSCGGLHGSRTLRALQLAMQWGFARLTEQADQQGLQCVSGG